MSKMLKVKGAREALRLSCGNTTELVVAYPHHHEVQLWEAALKFFFSDDHRILKSAEISFIETVSQWDSAIYSIVIKLSSCISDTC